MKKIVSMMIVFIMGFCIEDFAQTDSGMVAWQNYMTPSAVHKMIAKYDGNWDEDVTFWMQPGSPPTKSTSTAHNEMIMGGRYQESKITGNITGVAFEGFSLLGYDNFKKIFTSIWVDNFGTGTLTMEGVWDDASKTITFKGKELDPMSGKDINVKETMQLIDDNTQKFDMYNESSAGEFKMMEINLKRAM
jgi:hypothetical protein